MSSGNIGQTSLKCRKSAQNPMASYDRLPPELRAWLADAVLPWGAKSVHRAYAKAKARTGDAEAALAELDALQTRRVAQDAARVWGAAHPSAAQNR
ncbi:DUF6525 family protein [Roseobacteraceae bacterium S113]